MQFFGTVSSSYVLTKLSGLMLLLLKKTSYTDNVVIAVPSKDALHFSQTSEVADLVD
jgi:hypothetical protein